MTVDDKNDDDRQEDYGVQFTLDSRCHNPRIQGKRDCSKGPKNAWMDVIGWHHVTLPEVQNRSVDVSDQWAIAPFIHKITCPTYAKIHLGFTCHGQTWTSPKSPHTQARNRDCFSFPHDENNDSY